MHDSHKICQNHTLTYDKGENCMKKLTTIILALILTFFSFGIVGCKKDDNVIRLNETTHSIFYAPLYVAINLGYFEQEGLKIKLTNGGGSNNSMTALLSGEADVALLGPETAVYVANGETLNQPKIFGQLTKRDGSFLVCKTDTNNFQWTDLIGKTVIGGRRGGVPAMTLQYVIEQIAGLQIGTGADQVNLRTDVEFNLTASVYDSTEAQYCTLFEPTASDLVAQGKGHIVASVGQESGEIPYTCFMANQKYLQKNPAKIKSFLKAVIRGYRFLTTATVDQIADALEPSFTASSRSSIVTSIKSYIAVDAWNTTPVMKESALDYLQTVMMNAGELKNRVKFEDIVDNSFAEEVIAELNA